MKGTGNRVQRLVLISLLLAITIPYTLYPIPSYAQESSPSATIADKINALKEEIASKAAEIKTQITKKVQNKALIGKIISISDTEVTVQTLKEAKIIKIDEFTEVLGAKNKEIKIETLEGGDSVAALGDFDDKNTLVAQKLVFLENYASASARLIWGKIQKTAAPTITLITKDGNTESILTNSSTNYFLGNEEASIADAKVEKQLVARVTQQKNGTLLAKYIYFIPSMGFTKPDSEDSSPSAKIQTKPASPSATPKR